MNFEGDVLLISTVDGGDMVIQDDFVKATGGFETAAYLSLFGGNREDNGTESTIKKSWWGNQLEPDNPERRMISRTQNLMFGLEATPGNLLKIIEAAKQDLSWFKDMGIADTIEVSGRIPDRNRLELNIGIFKDSDLLEDFKFVENWKSQKGN